MAASASRGLIDLAMSIGGVPAATDCLLPSGRVISMLLIGNFQRNTGRTLDAEARDAADAETQQIAPSSASQRLRVERICCRVLWRD